MSRLLAKCGLIALALVIATGADAQHNRRREPRPVEHAPPPVPIDRRDSIVAAPGAFTGRPYWLALAECGGIYFKLNVLYSDAAAHAQIKSDDRKDAAADVKNLTQAIATATVYFDGAENFLMTDRGIERDDAVLTYDGQSRAAGEREKTMDQALAATRVCPPLYRACQKAHPKECSEPLTPTS